MNNSRFRSRFCRLGCTTTPSSVLLFAGVSLFFLGSRVAAPNTSPLFREVATQTGLNFQHFNGATGEYYIPEIMGAGVALIDYDNDGDLDVFLVQGSMLDKTKSPNDALFPPRPGWRPGCRLFRNELIPTGKLRFTDVTEQAGGGLEGYGLGVGGGDYDNVGVLDLYVTSFWGNVLYHNNGKGTFIYVTKKKG